MRAVQPMSEPEPIAAAPDSDLAISEGALTSLARQHLSPDATIWVTDDGIHLSTTAPLNRPRQLQARAQLGLRSGEPVLVLHALHVDGRPLSRGALFVASRLASDALADMVAPVEIQRLGVSEGTLYIRFAQP